MAHFLYNLLPNRFRKTEHQEDRAGEIEMQADTPQSRDHRSLPTSLETDRPQKDEVYIQPHTDDGGDPYYIGDAYEQSQCAGEWAIDTTNRPYLAHIKRVSKSLPHLEYLAHWMEVTASPPKWKFIKNNSENREERARRCNVCVLDFYHDRKPLSPIYDSIAGLKHALEAPPQDRDHPPDRLLIVEGLSRDVVELLGAKYDIEPSFFLSHIFDYLFHNTRDPWVELPDLEVIARQQQHFSLQYLRARYFGTQESFEKAEEETGAFNILRRLDSDRASERLQNSLLDKKGARVTLTRAKTSFWVKPRKTKDDPVFAVLLVDPTIQEGDPLWHGYRPFDSTPSMHSAEPVEAPSRKSLFKDAIFYSCRMSQAELQLVREDPKCFAIPMIRLVLADWRTVLKYMATMLGKIEWEFEYPHWGEVPSDINASLRKLSPWRRNMHYYKAMVTDSIDRIFAPELLANIGCGSHNASTANHAGVRSLLYDFRKIQKLMDENQQHIEAIQNVATNLINIEESRRAVKQNKNLARLTFLATIFIPLNFTSSFLSMSPDFSGATQTVWIFFVIGIPLSLTVLAVVDLSNPSESEILKLLRKWGVVGEESNNNGKSNAQGIDKIEIGKTVHWPTGRM